MTDISSSGLAHDVSHVRLPIRSDIGLLRTLAVAAGLLSSLLFILVGLRFDLEMFGDGAIFSYAVAVQDGWLFHWHNISARLFVHLLTHVPAETYVGLTGDARGGIFLYGLLFFGAPLLGLWLTFAADRSKGRIIFGYACFSTAFLCPLVFGAPTEMWMAHALFWPTLAACHYARGRFAWPAILALLLALAFTHEGALIFAIAILATLALRGVGDLVFLRALGAFGLVLAIWVVDKVALPPDDYFASILLVAALNFIDVSTLAADPFPVLVGAVACYGIAFLVLRRIAPARAQIHAGLIAVAAVTIYWLVSGRPVNGDNRYYLRTALLIFTPLFGAMAAAYALRADGRLRLGVPYLGSVLEAFSSGVAVRAACGALLMAMLVHAVETGRFVVAWKRYEDAVRALAVGTASDPGLGDPRFVSSARVREPLKVVEWPSTVQFLSILVAPGFTPARLVVDPDTGYLWLSCKTASASRDASRAIPAASRELVRVHACLYRR
jgi:hypothetical protein